MGKFIFLAVACLFLFSNTKTLAQTGCLVSGRIYTDKIDDVYGGFLWLFNRPQYDNSLITSYVALSGACPIGDQNFYARTTGGAGNRCGFTTSYNSNTVGYEYSYSIIRCPLDNYISFLFLPIGLFGFLRFRNYYNGIAQHS
ncbi:hypothetical protein [Pedobacter aquatilis]|uniref:hypothetical protein n=1 Tax=Pedobacter aquatilis TaxID=351343 RepID=UPI00292EF971|nr:hypothetical protein [Pedobacter aquatilis]